MSRFSLAVAMLVVLRLWSVKEEIGEGPSYEFGILIEEPDCAIALPTEQAADLTGHMIVIDIESTNRFLLAECARSALSLVKLAELFKRNAVPMAQTGLKPLQIEGLRVAPAQHLPPLPSPLEPPIPIFLLPP
jgi:hypothetical protein